MSTLSQQEIMDCVSIDKVTKIHIPGGAWDETLAEFDSHHLDSIDVMLENDGPGQGRITITCYGKAWTSYWGAMGKDKTIAEFFCSCDRWYLAGNLDSSLQEKITDKDALVEEAKKGVIQRRRDLDLDEHDARRAYDDIDGMSGEELYENHDLLSDAFGTEWYFDLPQTLNPDHEYLQKIIMVVKVVLREKLLSF